MFSECTAAIEKSSLCESEARGEGAVGHCRWIRAALRPCVAGFAALAIAVVLWGFGYKLSLYHPTNATRSQPAKLWTKQQDRVPPGAHVLKASLKLLAFAAGFAAFSIPPAPPVASASLVPVVHRATALAAFSYLTPLRSPPSPSLQA